MGQLISQFQEETTERVFGDYAFEDFHPRHHSWLPEQTKEAKRNYEEYNNYSSVTATVFVVVMIILLMVLLICCIKTVMVCRRQKRVNDQRRRIMQRQAESHHQNFEPRVYSIHGAFHHLPGGGIPQVFMPEDIYRCDEPPAYDQVIGLPPSYDSVIILNGVQSRGASVVGSVRNSVMGTVRSLRRGSRSAIQCGAPCQTDSVISASPPSEIGSTKSESLIASVSNAMVSGRYPMSEPEELSSQMDQSQRSRSTKSLRRNKSTFSLSKVKSEAEDEESLTAEAP